MGKVFIIDDSELVRTTLRSALEKGGFQVVEAHNGVVGVQVAKETPDISLIISDYNMPEMDGITMIRLIRGIPQYASTPVFMLTTESSPQLKQMAKAVGVMGWIVKPFTGDMVTDLIRKILVKAAS
jgi:two-component system chemotaxis response regulator CheY